MTGYKEAVLPKAVMARFADEAAVMDGWYKYIGLDGKVIGMNGFGGSVPVSDLFKHFSVTTEAVMLLINEIDE